MSFSLAVLCALEIESKPIISSLKLERIDSPFDPRLGIEFFSSSRNSQVCLIQFGKCPTHSVDRIGTQFASITAWETIKTLSPKTIASVGTAGGFRKKGANIGDVFISTKKIYFHGRHITVTGYKNFEIGEFKPCIIRNLGPIKEGIISSGDSVPLNSNDELRMRELETDAKDMEAAAIAEVAQLTNTPMFALKAISDFVDSSERTHTQFMANFRKATNNMAGALKFLVEKNNFG